MRWAVLVGGTGSNLRAILSQRLPVSLVISHRAGVKALDVAKEFNVPARVLIPRDYGDRADYDGALSGLLERYEIERVAMAGFLRWLGNGMINRYRGAIVNLHPSLLPAYPGLHAIERAFQDKVHWSGVTVHFVDEGHDTGPAIAQAPVPRLIHDSLEEFADRIHAVEHRLYPRALKALDAGELRWENGRIIYEGEDQQWMHGH